MPTNIVIADDGLESEVVGDWVHEKHGYLRRYLDSSRGARRMYLGSNKAGAAFVDLYCAFGRANIRDTSIFIPGSAIAAWDISREGKAPFSSVFIADIDHTRRKICAQRLKQIHAPVRELGGSAVDAAEEFVGRVHRGGLHFAFLDPHSLGSLDFRVIGTLSRLQRIDMLIHVSAMDFQRNLDSQLALPADEASEFDAFAPGWRKNVDTACSQQECRRRVLRYWMGLVEGLGMRPFSDMRLVTGGKGQRLYWLMLATRHELAEKLWKKIGRADGQGELLA